MERCAFCPTESKKLTGEHVWDDWLNRELPTKRYRARHRPSLDALSYEWTATELSQKVKAVCAQCNSTWMSRLSDRFRAGFRDQILHGSSLCILPSGVAVLSAYVFLKAVAVDYVYPDGEPFFTRAARETFKLSLAIPPYSQIWLSAFQGEALYGGRCIMRQIESTEQGPLYGVQWLAFTYMVGHLVLQLLAPRWKQIRHRGRVLPILSPDPFWDQATIRILPSGDVPITWPPPGYLGEEMVFPFAERFKARIRI
jgi:hypothetical protein